MQKKRSINFVFLVCALILGPALYREFDFQTHTFKNTALAILYGVVFVMSVVLLVREYIVGKKE